MGLALGLALTVGVILRVGAADLWTAAAAIGLGAASLAAFVALQGRGLDLIGAVAARWIKDTRERTAAIKAELAVIYASPGRLVAGSAWHAVGWVWSGAGAWIALRF